MINVPNPKDLRDRILNDINGAFNKNVTLLKNSVISVFTNVFSSVFYNLYITTKRVEQDVFINSSTDTKLLNYHGAIRGLTRKQATKSYGTVVFSGISLTEIPIGTLLVYGSNEYITTSLGVVGDTISSESVETGTSTNTPTNITLTLKIAISGVDNDVISVNGFSGATDIELINSYRSRVLKRNGLNSRIATPNFYKNIVLEGVIGLRQAYITRIQDGAGTFGVTAIRNDLTQPDLSQKLEIITIINDNTESYALGTYYDPIIVPINLTIKTTTTTVQPEVEDRLLDYLLNYITPNSTIFINDLKTVIVDLGATITSPTNDIFILTNEVAILGTVTYE